MPELQLVFVDIYQGKPGRFRNRKQGWRWRAMSEGNGRILASGEAFTNFADCLASVQLIFGDTTTVFKRQAEQSNVLLRRGVPQP